MAHDRAETVRRIAAGLGGERTLLQEMAWQVQARFGHLADSDVELLAGELGLHRVEVLDALSFYGFFQLRPAPAGAVIHLSRCVVGELSGAEEVAPSG